MAETLISPGIQITETDLSYVIPRPLVAGAALVGPTAKGPVMVPTKVTSYAQFLRTFGSTFEVTLPEETSGSIVIPERKEKQEYMTSMAAKSYFEQGGDSILVTRVADPNQFACAEGTKIPASGALVPFQLFTLSEGEYLNNVAGSEYQEYEEESGSVIGTPDERADYSLVSGSADNFRFEIFGVDEERGTFNLNIRRGDDTDKQKIVLESWQNLSLDPNSPNYIAARIGDQDSVFVPDEDGVHIDVSGNYTNKSAYVRVKVLITTPNYLDTEGNPVEAFKDYLPKECRGGFFGGKGKPGYRVEDDTETLSDVVYFEDIKSDSKYPQGVTCNMYKDAFDILQNADEYIFNVLSAPGLLGEGADEANIAMVAMAEERGDDITVVDLGTCDQSVMDIKENASKINSSYAAAYWPWLQMYSATGKLVWVPASVVIPGIYASTDKVAAPWFAPAGMNRGTIYGVIQARQKLVKSDRDKLYKANVNPIASFPGSGLVVYGQKTLQKKASALDRVNVRRLLIELKANVKQFAGKVLFEHNTSAIRNSFRAELETYLSSVVVRKGLYDYKIILDELNDAETIDRNEFRCQVILRPTKVIEFVYLDFTITNTGVEFSS